MRVSFTGENLPLVKSDLQVNGLRDGELDDDRTKVSVLLTAWSVDQRRFIERLVEHHLRG